MTDALADVPTWFHNRIVMGVQFLFALSLPGTPAGEVISITAQAWITALWQANVAWDEGLDSARLFQAFADLAAKTERWPAPRALLNHMPARREAPALPAPRSSPTPEQRARLAQFSRRWTDRSAA